MREVYSVFEESFRVIRKQIYIYSVDLMNSLNTDLEGLQSFKLLKVEDVPLNVYELNNNGRGESVTRPKNL